MGTELENTDHLLATDFQKIQKTMDRMVNDLHNLESIKKAMLEHDHLFKQQVKELHRLYGVQRMLMNELKHKVTIPAKTRVANGYCSEEKMINQGYPTRAKEHEPSTGGLEQGETGRIGTKGSIHGEEAKIELTLSIGNPRSNGNKSITKMYHHSIPIDNKWVERSQSQDDCGETVVTSDLQNRKRPHWLFRSLSSPNT